VRRRVGIGAFYLALSAVFTSPLFVFPNATGWRDWDFHLFLHAAVLKSVVEYAQLPLWNPWYCGGNVLWANPQASFFSLVYPLAAVMSIPLAMKINIVLHYWIGLVGMHVLLTRVTGGDGQPGLKTRPTSSLLILFLASAFVFSGAPALHLAVGHANFLPVFYLPLLLYFFLAAMESGAVKHAVVGGGILALMIWNGGLHVVPMAALMIGLLGMVSSLARRDWQPLWMATIVGLFGVLFAAPRIVPLLFFVTSPHFYDARGVTAHPDLMTLSMLARSLIDPYQNRGLNFPGQTYEWFEYGNYVGLPLVAALAASVIWIAVSRQLPRRRLGIALSVTTVAMLAISAGEFSSFAPASLFQHLPILSSFRAPSRYTMVFALCAATTVAWTAHAIGITRVRPWARIAIGVLCLLATSDLIIRNRAMLSGAFVQDPVDKRFNLLGGPATLAVNTTSSPSEWGSPMFRALMNGQSFYRCYEVMQTAPKADTVHPLVWSDDGRQIETAFSPNQVDFAVTAAPAASRVRLNENFARGWHSDAGSVEPDPETGQPSVVIAAGRSGTFSFVFTPLGLLPGCALGLLGIGAAMYGWPRRFPSTQVR